MILTSIRSSRSANDGNPRDSTTRRNRYLPPPNQHELGGYETCLGSSRVQEDAWVLIINQLLKMLAELKLPPGPRTL